MQQLTREEVLTIIKAREIEQIYYGSNKKCGCGCSGTYWNKPEKIQEKVTEMFSIIGPRQKFCVVDMATKEEEQTSKHTYFKDDKYQTEYISFNKGAKRWTIYLKHQAI